MLSPVMRCLRWILLLVCVADIILGCLIVFAPTLLFAIFNVPLPEDILWFQLIGVMLVPVAVDGISGFRDSYRYRANVVVSAGSRFASCVFLLIVATARNVPWILIVLGVGEGLVGILTVFYLIRLGAVANGAAQQSREFA